MATRKATQFVDAFNHPAAPAHLAEHRADRMTARLALQSAEALADALCAVADAVDRCEGPDGHCADPSRNPALGRATTPEEQAFLDDGGFGG